MADEKQRAAEAVVVPDTAAQLILGGRGSLYPGSEADYWRNAYCSEPYFEEGKSFDDYGPAYELGWTGYASYGGEFETADRVLANDWAIQKGISGLSWDEARAPCRAAWQRAHNARSYQTDGSADLQAVLDTLTELADNACDGELGFIEAAQHSPTPSLVALFQRRAQAYREYAGELHERIRSSGGVVPEGGTVTAAAHRVWLQVRGLLGGASDETLLAECQRGEDNALGRYRRALQQNLPADIHAVLQRQFESTQRNYDMIRTLLARMRANAQAPASIAS